MYNHVDGKSYSIITSWYQFVAPKNRNHEITVSYAEGGPELYKADFGLKGYIWKVYIKDGNKVVVKREDLVEENVIFTKDNISQLDFTFDQNMRPFITYVVNGLPYYYHFNAADSTYSEVELDKTITFPRCELDFRNIADIPKSDIILGYIRAGNLCYRVQRERYLKEHIIATDSKKTMLWRIGRLVDGRFGYQWR